MALGPLVGLASGLASALLFYSAAHGSPSLTLLLTVLTPLPSVLAGLGWGWVPALFGALTGVVLVGAAVDWPVGVGYGLALGVPTVLISYLAYLSRPDPNNPAIQEWYPAGRVVAAMTLYAGALPLLVLPLMGGSYQVLRGRMIEFFRRLSERTAPDFGMNPLTEEQITTLSDYTIAVLPGAFAAYWLAIFTLNSYLAGRIAYASGWLGRDWPDLATMAFPPGFPILVAVALGGTFLSGTAAVAGTSFTGAFLFAYLLAGLALVHFVARRPARWLLWATYGSLLLFGPYVAFPLILAGLLDSALNLRRRLGARPPTT